jgi:hypothetical protein
MPSREDQAWHTRGAPSAVAAHDTQRQSSTIVTAAVIVEVAANE